MEQTLESQQFMDESGQTHEIWEREYEKKFYRIETDMYYIERMSEAVDHVKEKVRELRDKVKYQDMDVLAESWVRGATKPKEGMKKLSRKEMLLHYARSIKIFKERIFGYNELTEEMLKEEMEHAAQQKGGLEMPKDQKRLDLDELDVGEIEGVDEYEEETKPKRKEIKPKKKR